MCYGNYDDEPAEISQSRCWLVPRLVRFLLNMATSGYFFQSFWDVRDLSNKLKKNCDTISDFFFDLNHHLSAVENFSVWFLTFFQPENIFHPISGSSENLSSSKMSIGYRGYVNCQADKSCQDDSFLLWNCWNSWGLSMIITSRPASSFFDQEFHPCLLKRCN